MPSVFSHAVVALALGPAFRRAGWPARLWWAGALCAVLPDADVVGVYTGVPLGSVFGHRGLTHSLAFAAARRPPLFAGVGPRRARERGPVGLAPCRPLRRPRVARDARARRIDGLRPPPAPRSLSEYRGV